MAKSLSERLQKGEVIERGVELCIDCPLYKKYVPLNGTCLTLEVDERNNDKNFQGALDSVIMPKNLTGYANGVWYKVTQKCEHALSVVTGGITQAVKGVVCSYKEKK